MWRILTLWLPLLLLLGTEVSQSQEGGAVMETEEGEEPSAPGSTTVTRRQILTAQFECYLKIIHDPPYTENGSFCNRTWDGWLCWGDTAPGTAMQLCPEYFKDFDPSEKVTKVCNSDGQWFRHPESGRLWSNYTECQLYTPDKRMFTYILYYLAMVGHGLSVGSLLISLLIFSYFKSLSCQRISLHKNLFLSLLFNSIFSVIWLSAVANNQDLVASNPISCKILSVLNQYMSGCNYFWMLCEGIYLHTLIIVAVFVGEQQLFWYYVLGWGFPVIPAAMFAVARGLFYNDNCWISINTNLPYVVQGPIQVALIVNLFFLLNIVRVMITKLRVTHSAESNTYMKAVRATLILVPLLGAQFILVPWRPGGRTAGAVYESIMQVFSNSQGLLVAIIFCFCNSEVQTALRRKWSQRSAAWGDTPVTTDSHGHYHSNSSVTESSRATLSLELTDHAPCDAQADAHSHAAKKGRVIHRANGQSNGKHGAANGEADVRRGLETTSI